MATRHGGIYRADEFTVQGISTAGVETSLRVPQWGVVFDIGVCPQGHASASHLFVTHGHPDHVGALGAWLGLRDLHGLSPANVYAPAEVAEDFVDAVRALGRLSGRPFAVDVHGVVPGDVVELRRDLRVEVFEGRHIVPTRGYAVVRRKHKLREPFRALPGEQIAAMRRAGRDDLFDVVDDVLLAYPGDAEPALLEDEPLLQRAGVLVFEASFLDERKSMAAVRAGGHTHLDDIAARSEFLREVGTLLLIHFSQIYSSREVETLVRSRLPAELAARTRVLTGGWEEIR